jgi:acyl-CoA-binding protein
MEKSLLHLVFGGRVKDTRGVEFEDPSALDIVGIYPNYKQAYEAWRGVSQRHVDDARMKYVVVHLHRLLDPETDHPSVKA